MTTLEAILLAAVILAIIIYGFFLMPSLTNHNSCEPPMPSPDCYETEEEWLKAFKKWNE